jgi:hypothetical protein
VIFDTIGIASEFSELNKFFLCVHILGGVGLAVVATEENPAEYRRIGIVNLAKPRGFGGNANREWTLKTVTFV